MTINEIRQKILAIRPRSAWHRAVVSDAVDLVDSLSCSKIPNNWKDLKKALLNGAADWSAYSYGGCALAYDEDIARHYCTPSELRKVTHKDGTISERANAQENWLDVQARALWQAANLIRQAAGL